MKVRALAGSLLSAYTIAASLLVAALAGTGVVLWRQGLLDKETFEKIGRVLRKQPVGDVTVVEKPPEEFARDVERMKKAAQEQIDVQRRDLAKQEQEFKTVHAEEGKTRESDLAAREAKIAQQEKAFEAQTAEREAVVRADELARSNRNFKLDLDLLSRLDANQAAKILIDMDLDRAVLLLRSLRSRVAGDVFAEILAANPARAAQIQDALTASPGLSPSEVRRLSGKLADWELEDLVALLRLLPGPEREAFVREITDRNASMGAKLAERLSISPGK